MGSQRVGHGWATELNWTSIIFIINANFSWSRFLYPQHLQVLLHYCLSSDIEKKFEASRIYFCFYFWHVLSKFSFSFLKNILTLLEYSWFTACIWSLCQEDHWRREWPPTPIFLPGELHGQSSLLGYSPQGHKESVMTEWLRQTHTHRIDLQCCSSFRCTARWIS